MKKVMIFAVPNSFSRNTKDSNYDKRISPLGLATLGAVLMKDSSVKLLDGLTGSVTLEGVLKAIENYNPDILLLSVFDRCRWALEPAGELIKNIKKPLIGLIGTHNPQVNTDIMKRFENIGFSTYGDPEYTVLQILKEGKVEGVEGAIYRDNSLIHVNKPRPLIQNLDELPLPARELFDMKIYERFPHENKTRNPLDIQCARGCPFGCSFCSVKLIESRAHRSRSPQAVAAEIAFLMQKYSSREVNFLDPVMTLDREWTMQLCRVIKPLKIEWSCQTRADLVDEELLSRMKSAGCFSILFGIETLDGGVLSSINKGVKYETVKKALDMTKRLRIEARVSCMLGLPQETSVLAKRMVKQVISMKPDFAQFHCTVAFPGTELYEKAGTWGRLDGPSSREFDLTGYPFIPAGYRDSGHVRVMQRYAYRRFYLRPGFIFNVMKSPSGIKRYLRGLGIFLRILLEK